MRKVTINSLSKSGGLGKNTAMCPPMEGSSSRDKSNIYLSTWKRSHNTFCRVPYLSELRTFYTLRRCGAVESVNYAEIFYSHNLLRIGMFGCSDDVIGFKNQFHLQKRLGLVG